MSYTNLVIDQDFIMMSFMLLLVFEGLFFLSSPFCTFYNVIIDTFTFDMLTKTPLEFVWIFTTFTCMVY